MDIFQESYHINEDETRMLVSEHVYKKVFLMKMPIMLRTEYCWLKNANDRQLTEFGECPLDQGGYFIINGSEKVLITSCFLPNGEQFRVRLRQEAAIEVHVGVRD